MAGFAEKVLIKIDVTADNAVKNLKNLRTEIKQTEGFTGKLKTGVRGLGDVFKSAASNPAVLAGGIAAAGSAAYTAVTKFSDLGVEVGKFSDATGLSTEESSRWIEVAGDAGVESAALEGALNKLNKNIDPSKFAELGVEIAKTNEGATDVNGTFLNVIDTLKGIKDPAQRAKVGTELLGKSWTGLAELIQRGSGELQESLDGVSEAKVLSPAEVKKAREFRDAMDNLQDVAEDLAITLGQHLAPALSDVADQASHLANSGLVDVLGKVNDLGNAITDLNVLNPFGWAPKAEGWVKSLSGAIFGTSKEGRDFVTVSDEMVGAHQAEAYTAQLAASAELEQAKELERLADAAGTAAERVETLDEKTQEFLGNLDKADLLDNTLDAFDNVESAAEDFFTAVAEGSPQAASKQRDYEAAVRETQRAVQDLENEGLLNRKQTVRIQTLIDQGKLAEAKAIIASIEKPSTKYVNVVVNTGKANVIKFATGTSAAPGGPALVGETGPEIVDLPKGARVTSSIQSENILNRQNPAPYVDNRTYNILIPNQTPERTAQEITRYNRRNGIT